MEKTFEQLQLCVERAENNLSRRQAQGNKKEIEFAEKMYLIALANRKEFLERKEMN